MMGNRLMRRARNWTLNESLVLVLFGAFAMLLLETRFEHRHAVLERSVAWTPIVVSAAMLPVSALGLVCWPAFGRRALFVAYAAVTIVGGAGFWFHSRSHPLALLQLAAQSWVRPVKYAGPPPLAPLSFCGLGAMGMLACLQLPLRAKSLPLQASSDPLSKS